MARSRSDEIAPLPLLEHGSYARPDLSILRDALMRFIAMWILLSAFPARSFGQQMGGGRLPESPGCIAFSEDGSQLARSAINKIYVWSMATGELRQTIDASSRVGPLAWVPGQAQIAAGSSDGSICLWNSQTGEPLPPIAINQGVIHHLAFSADGIRLLVACEAWEPDGLTVALWDFRRRMVKTTLAHEKRSLSGGIAFSPDQTTVAFGVNPLAGQSEVRRWRIESNEWITPLVLAEGKLKSVAFSPDGSQIVGGGWQDQGNGRAQGMISRWSTTDAAQVQAEVFPELNSMLVRFAPDGESLVGGASLLTSGRELAGLVARWPLGAQQAEWEMRINSHHINAIAFSPGGNLLAFSSSGTRKEMSQLKLVAPQSGEVTASLWPPVGAK